MAPSDLPRVQYRPGSGGAVYAVVLALVTTAAFYSQSNLLFATLGLMIGGLVFALIWAWLSLRDLRVRRSNPPRVSAGEPLVLRYHVDNHGRLPVFGLVLRERPADDPTADGAPGRPRRLDGLPVTWALHVGPQRGIRMQSRRRARCVSSRSRGADRPRGTRADRKTRRRPRPGARGRRLRRHPARGGRSGLGPDGRAVAAPAPPRAGQRSASCG